MIIATTPPVDRHSGRDRLSPFGPGFRPVADRDFVPAADL
jgi:hypothetical protein